MTRRSIECNPEQFAEVKRAGIIEISDGNGRRETLASVEKLLTKSANTRSLIYATGVILLALGGVIWRTAEFYHDGRAALLEDRRVLEQKLDDLNASINARTQDRWWGQAEAVLEQTKLARCPEYAKFYASPDDIIKVQNTVRERMAERDGGG